MEFSPPELRVLCEAVRERLHALTPVDVNRLLRLMKIAVWNKPVDVADWWEPIACPLMYLEQTTESEEKLMWLPISQAPEGIRVMTRTSNTKDPSNVIEQPLTKRGRLWFADDGNYVYFEPNEWRHLAPVEQLIENLKSEKKTIERMLERLKSGSGV